MAQALDLEGGGEGGHHAESLGGLEAKAHAQHPREPVEVVVVHLGEHRSIPRAEARQAVLILGQERHGRAPCMPLLRRSIAGWIVVASFLR